jgi:hypothetical protein
MIVELPVTVSAALHLASQGRLAAATATLFNEGAVLMASDAGDIHEITLHGSHARNIERDLVDAASVLKFSFEQRDTWPSPFHKITAIYRLTPDHQQRGG